MFEVVVARFQENLDWVKKVKWPVRVYNKGGPIELPCERLKNIGREAQTYLHHIIKEFDKLADYTVFLQGNPYRHTRDLDLMLDGLPGTIERLRKMSSGCWSLSNEVLVHTQQEIEAYKIYPEDFHNAFFEKPKRVFKHAYGAQYIVHKSAIVNKPVEFFRHIHDSCSWQRHEPWSIERVWPAIFDAEDLYIHKIKSFYS
jgi:hypothetical protein